MFHQSPGAHEPDPHKAEARERLASKILDEASLLVASFVELLGKRSTAESLKAVEVLRREGVVTGRDLCVLMESRGSPEFISELLWAYSYITKRVVDLDIAQGYPALLSLAHQALTAPTPNDRFSPRRLLQTLDRILDARMGNDELADHLSAVTSVNEQRKLEEIAVHAPQGRNGYWEALELMCAVNPSSTSLDYIFKGLDRIGGRRYTKAERAGVQRCVSAVAAHNFPDVFEYVAHAVQQGTRNECVALVQSTAAGLAFHADGTVGALCRYLSSTDEAISSLACRVCILADKEGDIELSTENRQELRDELVELVRRGVREGRGMSMELALAALAHISTVRDDIDMIDQEVRKRLRDGDAVSSEMVLGYSEGLSRVEGEGGIVGFKPLSWRRVIALSSNPPLNNGRGAVGRGVVAPDTEHVFENLAIEISSVGSFDEVVALCREHSRFVDRRALHPRGNDSLSLFYDVMDASRFCRHYAELCEQGPIEFAAALFPEFLSALEQGRSAERENISNGIGGDALRATAALTSLLANNHEIRELATARMCSGDWQALSTIHKRVEGDFSAVYPDLGLAVFALRATIEDRTAWQKELLRWWKGVDARSRDFMDPNALAFVSIAAERSTPGAALGLLTQMSLTNEDAQTFRDVALGLIIRPEASIQAVIDLASSSKADSVARGLLLSQLMARFLTDAQRKYIVGIAKRSMDELGILSLDAVSTIGALSRSPSDALMLIESAPALGVSPALHRVSAARAAGRILRYIERGL